MENRAKRRALATQFDTSDTYREMEGLDFILTTHDTRKRSLDTHANKHNDEDHIKNNKSSSSSSSGSASSIHTNNCNNNKDESLRNSSNIML